MPYSDTLSFFRRLFEILGDHVALYAVRDGNHEMVAGGIMTYFRDTVVYGYGAADPGCLKSYPYHAFLWRAIEDACLNGFRQFDFGRASYDNVGLISFKKRWGTKEKPLYYSYYPEISKSITGDRGSLKYRFATSLMRKAPIPMYKRLSDIVFGSFG